jgi:hypothetical protein
MRLGVTLDAGSAISRRQSLERCRGRGRGSAGFHRSAAPYPRGRRDPFRARGAAGGAGRVDPAAPGPRRRGVRRPARSRGARPGRLQAGQLHRVPRAGRPAAFGVRGARQRHRGAPIRRDRESEAPHRRGGGDRGRDPAAQSRHPCALRDRGRDGRGRIDPAPPSHPRSAPPPAPAGPAAAARALPGHPGLPRRAGLPRDRDAHAREVHARGRAGLPGAQPAPARRVLRAAAVTPDHEAAAHGRGLRSLLPDRPLLPRRGRTCWRSSRP